MNLLMFRKSNRTQASAALHRDSHSQGKKSLSLQSSDSSENVISIGGGYVSSIPRHERRSLNDNSSSSSGGSSNSESSWKPSSDPKFHSHSPLVARRSEPPTSGNGSTKVHPDLDDAEELGMVMARARQLPGNWYYSSNHILVNKERTKNVIPPLIRRIELDELARAQAAIMASNGEVQHSNPQELLFKLGQPCRRLGENVASGSSIKDIHKSMMKHSIADKNNILDRRYVSMGMGTAKGSNGELYMCQIFKG